MPSGLLKDILLKMTPGIPTVAGKSPSSKMFGDPLLKLHIEYIAKITTSLI